MQNKIATYLEGGSFTNIKSLLQKLYDEDAENVKQTLEEIGKVGKGNREATKALQEFLRKEQRMPLRILATQVISNVKRISRPSTEGFKKPVIFQCPGAEKIKRIEIIDVTCPHCHKNGTASVAGFENEYACESCGGIMPRDLPESCIEKCPVGSECVGEERYQKYMKSRKNYLNKKGKSMIPELDTGNSLRTQKKRNKRPTRLSDG